MGITVRKEKGVNDAVYYKAYDVGHVRGKIVQKYVGSIGKSQNSTGEVEPQGTAEVCRKAG